MFTTVKEGQYCMKGCARYEARKNGVSGGFPLNTGRDVQRASADPRVCRGTCALLDARLERLSTFTGF